MSPEQLSLFGAPAAPAPKKQAEKEAAEKSSCRLPHPQPRRLWIL